MSLTTEKQKLPLPPMVEGGWPIGSARYFAEDPFALFEKSRAKYGDMYRWDSVFFRFMPQFDHFIIVANPDAVKHIMQDNNRNYVKSFAYQVLSKLVGNGLLTSEGDFWRKQRRLIQPGFHRDKLAAFGTIMTDACNEMLNEWRQLEEGSVVNVSKDMMALTLKIVCRAMFSTDVGRAIEVVSREFDMANELINDRIVNPQTLPLWLPTPRNRREKHAYAAIQEVVINIIEERRKGTETYDDLLSMLIETEDADTGERMTDKQVQDEVITLFLAGHETTAVALSWMFVALEENPEVEQKALAEALSVLNSRVPTFAEMRNLTYTRMVVDETLRLYPPAWLIGRHSLENDEAAGFRIPAKSNCMIPVYAIHRDPRYWEKPEQFLPERFNPESNEKRHKFVYFPFGGGPRLCIGNNFALMEMQLIIPMILQEFKLSKIPGQEIKKEPLLTMRQSPHLKMTLTKRASL